jgi:hypothetical protein
LSTPTRSRWAGRSRVGGTCKSFEFLSGGLTGIKAYVGATCGIIGLNRMRAGKARKNMEKGAELS